MAEETIEIRHDFFDHPQIKQLQSLTGPEGVMSFIRLMIYVAKVDKKGGHITKLGLTQIEVFADWHGKKRKLGLSLRDCGLIKHVTQRWYISAWHEWQPKFENARARSEAARTAAIARWDKHRENHALVKKAAEKGCVKARGEICVSMRDASPNVLVFPDDLGASTVPSSRLPRESREKKETKAKKESPKHGMGHRAKSPNYSDGFELFWVVYPHPSGKGRPKRDAFKWYRRALGEGYTDEQIRTAAQNYARSRAGEYAKYNLYARTFLSAHQGDPPFTEFIAGVPDTDAPSPDSPQKLDDDTMAEIERRRRALREAANVRS